MLEFFKYFFFIVTATAAAIWIVDRFWSSFYERKKLSPLSLLPWSLYCLYQGFILYDRLTFQPGHSLLSFFVNTLIMFLIVVLGYEAEGRRKYFLFILFCAIWAMIELALELIINMLRLDNYATMCVGSASSVILMMAFTHIVSSLWDKKYTELPPPRFYFPLLLIPAGCIYIMLSQYMLGINNILSSSIISILLLFNLIVFHIYVRFNQFFLRERENAVHAEQLSLISQNMEEQKKLMDDFYREKHNLINELTALRGKMSQEGAATALSELDRILDDYHNMRSVCASGNAAIDALINAKYATAQTYGISFQLHICVPADLAVAARDLGVVIGNALDNAITAARDCRLAEKNIQLSMGVRKNAFIMVIKNPYEHPLKKARNGELFSTKPNSGKHGYGLRSIRRIAESYDGDMILDTDNGLFSLTVILNFNEF